MALEWRGRELALAIREESQKAVLAAAIILQTECQNTLNRSASHGGRGASKPGGPPAKRSGALYRIQVDKRRIREPDPTARTGTNVIYARIQEFGGTVRAKRVKYLPIPLNYEAEKLLTRSGSIQDAEGQRKSLRSVPGLFVVKRGKNLFLCRLKRKRG